MEHPKPPEMTPEEKIDILYEVACMGVRNFLIRMGHDLEDPEEIRVMRPVDIDV